MDLFGNLREVKKVFKIRSEFQRVDWQILEIIGIYFKVPMQVENFLESFYIGYNSKDSNNNMNLLEKSKNGPLFFLRNVHNTNLKEISYNYYNSNILTNYSLTMNLCGKVKNK